MSGIKTVLNCETGETAVIKMTAQEEAQQDALAVSAAAEQAAESARQTKLSGARPANAILVKLRDGTDLTPAEMQRVVRYLALQAVREARG